MESHYQILMFGTIIFQLFTFSLCFYMIKGIRFKVIWSFLFTIMLLMTITKFFRLFTTTTHNSDCLLINEFILLNSLTILPIFCLFMVILYRDYLKTRKRKKIKDHIDKTDLNISEISEELFCNPFEYIKKLLKLLKAMKLVLFGSSFDKISKDIFNICDGLMRIDCGYILLNNEEIIFLKCGIDVYNDEIFQEKIISIFNTVKESKEIYVNNKFNKNPLSQNNEFDKILVSPLIVEHDVEGYLILANYKEDFSEDNIIDINSYSEVISAALNNHMIVKMKAKLENELLQSQKMESLITLTKGISHDFNNIFMVIDGYSNLISLAKNTEEVKEYLEFIISNCKKAQHLINRLLTFSRKTNASKEKIDFTKILMEYINFVRLDMSQNIELKLDISKDHLYTSGDYNNLYQAIENIVSNSIQSIPKDKNGEIKINLYTVDIEDFRLLNMLPGKYIKLQIKDNGIGIDESELSKIFDPFYTTNQKREHMGLGLSIVYKIIKDHSGKISIFSTVGEGTLVDIFLPVYNENIIEEKEEIIDRKSGKDKTIFIIEENSEILKLEKLMIEKIGFKTIVETDPVKALQYFIENKNNIDLVMTDYIMPYMNGIELAQNIKKMETNTPVVLCTGFDYNLDEDHLKLIGIDKIIRKPIYYKELEKALFSLIDRRVKERRQT